MLTHSACKMACTIGQKLALLEIAWIYWRGGVLLLLNKFLMKTPLAHYECIIHR